MPQDFWMEPIESPYTRVGDVTGLRFEEDELEGIQRSSDTVIVSAHIDDETLEMHALGRLPGIREHEVKEHVLSCVRCERRYAQVREYAEALKEALKRENGLIN